MWIQDVFNETGARTSRVDSVCPLFYLQRNFSMSVNSAAVLRLTGRGSGPIAGPSRGRSTSRGRGKKVNFAEVQLLNLLLFSGGLVFSCSEYFWILEQLQAVCSLTLVRSQHPVVVFRPGQGRWRVLPKKFWWCGRFRSWRERDAPFPELGRKV